MMLQSLRRLFSLGVVYQPQPEERPFLQRLESQRDEDVVVRTTVAVRAGHFAVEDNLDYVSSNIHRFYDAAL